MNIQNLMGVGSTNAYLYFAGLSKRLKAKQRADTRRWLTKQKFENVGHYLHELRDAAFAKRHGLPRVIAMESVPEGILKNGSPAHFLVDFDSVKPRMHLYIETEYSSRPSRRIRRRIIMGKRGGSDHSIVLFVYEGQKTDNGEKIWIAQDGPTLRNNLHDVIRLWLIGQSRLWEVRLSRGRRREAHALVTCHRRQIGCRIARAA